MASRRKHARVAGGSFFAFASASSFASSGGAFGTNNDGGGANLRTFQLVLLQSAHVYDPYNIMQRLPMKYMDQGQPQKCVIYRVFASG